jgi:enamine deaminase RidA (YjgF/YER057c/UK114 family)
VEAPESPHRLVNPPTMAPAVGFAHAVVSAPGRLVFLGGQTNLDGDGVCRGETVVEQFDLSLANVVEALEAAGGRPEHLVSMQIFATDAAAYRASLKELGEVYRRHLGRHYPAMALFEVSGLYLPESQIELVCVAVVPDGD